jgi:hypothetical protein
MVAPSPPQTHGSIVISPNHTEAESVARRGPLEGLWQQGYSIGELWGYSAPTGRGTSMVDVQHVLLWGILGIVEYQVDQGAGHRYLRERLGSGDWVAIGVAEPKTPFSRLVKVPPFKDAKFGRKPSAIGDGVTKYVDVRIVHAQILDEF